MEFALLWWVEADMVFVGNYHHWPRCRDDNINTRKYKGSKNDYYIAWWYYNK